MRYRSDRTIIYSRGKWQAPAGLPLFQVPFVGNSKLRPALRPAAGQYLPAIGGLHSFPEPMYRFPAAVVWLKCTLHDNYFL